MENIKIGMNNGKYFSEFLLLYIKYKIRVCFL